MSALLKFSVFIFQFSSALARASLIFLILYTLYFILTPLVHAEGISNCGPEGCTLTKENYTAPLHTNYTLDNTASGMLCMLGAGSPYGCINRELIKVEKEGAMRQFKYTYTYDYVPGGGAIGGLAKIMVAMYQSPPTSTVQYLADIGQNFGFAKPAYAQVGGSGAGIIEPVKILWEFTSKLTYVLFIIVFVVVGFMIMFRTKINPQTVISVQAALPGLVIGLILVIFSYFIAALIIDTSFLGIQVIGNIFMEVKGPNGIINTFKDIPSLKQNSNALELFFHSFRLWDNFTELFRGIGGTLLSVGSGALSAPVLILLAIFALPAAIVGLSGLITTGAISLLIPLILIIALVIQFIRLLIKLIFSYIALLVITIFGPFIILFSSIPGRGGALGVWWKTLLGNALVFPAVFAAFLFAGFILGTSTETWKGAPPLFGGLPTELLRLIIAYGIILGTPAIPDMVKKALGVPDLKGIPEAAMAGAAAGFGVGRSRVANIDYIKNLRLRREADERSGIVGRSGSMPVEFAQRARGWQGAIAKMLGGGK